MLALLLCAAATVAHAGTVSGVVHNGTNGNKPAAGVDVLLIQLQGGMQTVASTKTDADGRYHFDNPAIGGGPMLIRAVYRGVFFTSRSLRERPPSTSRCLSQRRIPRRFRFPCGCWCFSPTATSSWWAKSFPSRTTRILPPRTTSRMAISSSRYRQGAELDQVSTFGPSGMPVRQGTIDKGKGRYAIAYAFQPGQNGVRISYILPYAGDQAALRETSTYDAQRVLLVIPPTMQISSPGFNPAGTEQGFNVFSKESVKAGTGFDISVSGTAPPPAEASAAPDQVNGRDSGDAAPAPTIQTVPARLDDEKWILLGGLAAIFAVGVGLAAAQTRRSGPGNCACNTLGFKGPQGATRGAGKT